MVTQIDISTSSVSGGATIYCRGEVERVMDGPRSTILDFFNYFYKEQWGWPHEIRRLALSTIGCRQCHGGFHRFEAVWASYHPKLSQERWLWENQKSQIGLRSQVNDWREYDGIVMCEKWTMISIFQLFVWRTEAHRGRSVKIMSAWPLATVEIRSI